MNGLSSSEILFYGGIALMGLAAVGAVASAVIFKATGKKLKDILEQEYGKCLR